MEKFLHPVELKNVSYERNKIRFQKKFKNFYLLSFGISCFMILLSLNASSKDVNVKEVKKVQNINSLTSNSDTTSILLKCLDSEKLLPLLAKKTDGNYSKIYIMQYLVNFSKDINISKFSETVSFSSRQEIHSNNIKSYFIFKDFSIDGNIAKVEFDYTNNSSAEKVFEITANLEKSGIEWKIIDLTVNHK